MQTAEHILANLIEEKTGASVVIAKFHEEYGAVDFNCDADLRILNTNQIEREVNNIISRNQEVKEGFMERSKEEEEFDILRESI